MMISVSVVARKMVVVVGQQLVAQLGIVGQLAVEAEAEPLVLLQVVPLERLGVVQIVLAARGITNVADGRPAGHPRHDALGLAAMAQLENLADGPDAAECVEQLLPVGMVARHAGRELAAVLHIQQDPRDEPRNFVRPLRRAQRAYGRARQMVDGGKSALVMKFAHGIRNL